MPQPRKDEQARQMYEMYLRGQSLAQVAQTWNVTRQSVYSVFQRRGWPLRSKTYQPTVEFMGETYSPDPDGYFRKTRGDRAFLHRVIWEQHNGPIPPRRDIHHADEDKANNDLSNLICVTPSEHGQIHMPLLPTPERECLFCGKALVRKRSPGGQLETPAAVRRRTYCDAACQGDHRRGKPKGWGPRREPPASL